MPDEYGKSLSDHQRDVAAGRFGKPGAGNPHTLSYQYGAKLGGRDPRTGQPLNNSTTPSFTTPDTAGPATSTGNVSPGAAIGMLLAAIAIIGFFVIQAQDHKQRAAVTKARVAPTASPTHFVTNGNAKFFYATGSNKGKPASSKIVEPRVGKCFDLTKINQSTETVTVDLESYLGQVFRMYTSSANFAPLPSNAVCKHGYYNQP